MLDWNDLLSHPAIRQLMAMLAEGRGQLVNLQGLWGSFGPLLVGLIYRTLGRPILYIRPYVEDAFRAVDDLQTFGIKADLMAAWEDLQAVPDGADPVNTARTRLVLRASQGRLAGVVCGSVQAIGQPLPSLEAINRRSMPLATGRQVSLDDLVGWLTDNGFEPVDRPDIPGQFARRGGILDIFAPIVDVPGLDTPDGGLAFRVEFFGDDIETIRKIDLDTLRSTELIEQVRIIAPHPWDQSDRQCHLADILPAQSLVVLEEPADCQQVLEALVQRSNSRLLNWAQVYKGLAGFRQLHISRFGHGDGDALVVDVRSVQQYQLRHLHPEASSKGSFGNVLPVLEQLTSEAAGGKKVYLFCQTAAELQRLQDLLADKAERLRLVQGYLSGGFTIESLGLVVVTHHELFGQHLLRRLQGPTYQTAAIDNLEDLEPGDYVVHAIYGIGRYLGLETIQAGEGRGEYLAIEYADKAKIYVSVNNIQLVQRYIGTGQARPKLSRIGSRHWQRQKEKVYAAVTDLAAEMLATQAKRQALGGFAFGPDSQWQQQFEASFPYVETLDQTIAIKQIKEDMTRPIAMDRLLCGDVGYGKTELAMRAAFKAVESGKQVAVLVPTTVLSIQHGRTFMERFADFPVCIEVLNRFRSPSEVADILDRTSKGGVDILIGTHRLLSGDVVFKDLGLLIIDEEQRFGVEHKERLKRMRVNVDILTMTATPIPRTLH
ncbi:MAG: CarD family transcriptional regulator, partial [Sedimentisphaerales bacterium]|nr:CarD family transcriptional regulator [Sedimentisphaerales bacterium]